MKKDELKKILKPLIKECIKEVIFEDGTLSNIVSEVAQGLGRTPLVEAAPAVREVDNAAQREAMNTQRIQEAQQRQQQLLSAIGTDAYGGVNVFEGTTPLSSPGSPGQANVPSSPLGGVMPNDAGVDIHKNDYLGKLNVNDDGLLNRDLIVINFFKKLNIPIATVIGGGYSKDNLELANRHSVIFNAVDKVFN